jgi:hypothetical protein
MMKGNKTSLAVAPSLLFVKIFDNLLLVVLASSTTDIHLKRRLGFKNSPNFDLVYCDLVRANSMEMSSEGVS